MWGYRKEHFVDEGSPKDSERYITGGKEEVRMGKKKKKKETKKKSERLDVWREHHRMLLRPNLEFGRSPSRVGG